MSGREVIAVVVIAAALVTAVLGLAAVVGRVDLSAAQRAARTGLSREQRRAALRVVRAGGAPAPDQWEHVVVVATGLSSHGGAALTWSGLALTCTSFAFSPSSPPWLAVVAVVAATGNAVVAVVAATWWRQGRRWVADHPDPGAAARSGARR